MSKFSIKKLCVRELTVIRAHGLCVRKVGPFVWEEAQPLTYKYVHLFLDKLSSHLALLTWYQQPSSIPNLSMELRCGPSVAAGQYEDRCQPA
jgi:hypothetical protein